MRARWAAATWGIAVLAGVAEATSAEKTAPTAAAGEDAITGAKRDLEAIKALRGPAADAGRSDVPMLAAPEMVTAPNGPTALRGPGGNLPKGTKGPAGSPGNWLVDAMAKKSERTATGRAPDTGDERRDETEVDRLTAGGGRSARESERDPGRRDDKGAMPAVINPLSTFMAGWMSPQDYQLLRSGWAGGAAKGTTPEGAVRAWSEGAVAMPTPDRGFTSTASPAQGGASSRENPFLAALGPAVPGPTVAPSAAPTWTPPAPVVAKPALDPLPPPPVPSPAASTVPSFVKPLDDAKYFKPLKKF